MIAIVDYNAGNLTSVKRALDHLEIPCEITPDPERVKAAERVIFPGVGHAASAMATLSQRGLDKALHDAFEKGTPILGICLGAQVVLAHSSEGDTACLGLIDGDCPRFELSDESLKVPHMGWDRIQIERKHPVLAEIDPADEFYFVHSYYPQPADTTHVLATCEYETVFPAVVGRDNLVATQFHPEKSGKTGLRILRSFSTWDGTSC
ncbi:MAG: imidazole glycerol phosphate synthase subunit HisH [Chitinivibrionales bacterium]|nr:imidazole glycerol phosphate synthase subunit HisH [Chitinivibrionales bacterium]